MKRQRGIVGIVAAAMVCFALLGLPVVATDYGSGAYGACQYQTCSISVASSGTANVPITPGGGTTCTTASDTVTVSTGSSTGYTLQLAASDGSNDLTSGSSTISASTGTQSSPTALVANSWGYRVDGVGGFGAGPTTAGVNTAVPTEPFAAVPIAASPDTIASTSSSATNEATDVWYGVCVDAATPAGTYVDTVTYTAVVN